MRLWDRLIRRDGYWEGMASGAAILTTTYGSPDREQIIPQVSGWAQQANASDGVVFAAIIARMTLFSEGQFAYQRASDDGMFGNTTLHLLEHPWPNGTAGELLARMEQDASVAGNAYMWKVPGEDRLVRLRPDWVTIVSQLVNVPGGGQYREKLGYWWEPPKSVLDQGKGQFYPVDEVAHWAPVPDPQANFRGMSWLTPVYRDINADSGMVQHKIKYLENAATPNIVVRYSQKLSPGTIDGLRERINARYGGTANAYKTLILDQGADLTAVGNSLAQMDFTNVAQAGTERILAAAQVPPLVVGLEPIKGAGKSYEQVMRHFADLWARPQWRSVCAALEGLTDEPSVAAGGARLWIDTGDISALQDGEQVRAQVALIRAQALLAYVEAGYTRESAVTAVDAGDVTQLVPDPTAQAGPAMPTPVQHLLPQTPPGATASPLPPGAVPRLPVGSTSPGDGGNSTRPTRRPAAARRSLPALNGTIAREGGNPYHVAAGATGGQFTSAGGVGAGGYGRDWDKGGDAAADSLTAHSPGGHLTPERAALHEQIISKALAGTSRSAHPTATFLGGGPASGKSEMLKQQPVHGVVIDPDAVKAQLPEYQARVDAGDKGAAAYVHEESSAIAKKIMARAIAGGRDFTLDGTGDSSYAKLAGKIAAARDAGYRTHGQYVTVDTDTAAARAAKRGERTGRVVPETYLRETHAAVSGAFRRAVEDDAFDTADLFDNNASKGLNTTGIRRIGSKPEGGTFKVTDQDAYARFLAKEHESGTGRSRAPDADGDRVGAPV